MWFFVSIFDCFGEEVIVEVDCVDDDGYGVGYCVKFDGGDEE